jgi:Fe-S-cluster containining protein
MLPSATVQSEQSEFMTRKADAAPRSMDVRVAFRINGRPVHVEARVSDRPARLDELLPALRTIDDRLIETTITDSEAAGGRISCTKGCSACCRRQPVPITPPEAFALARIVDALSEPRQAAVRSAFAAAVERLRAAGLYEIYMRRDPEMTREAALATVRRYMALALACPFLVENACGIYAERPFVCRQYLVTSPAELCTAPLDNPVRPVEMPAAFATAMLQAGETLSGRAQYTIPLVLALDYADAHRDELERMYDSHVAFGELMRSLQSQLRMRATPSDPIE